MTSVVSSVTALHSSLVRNHEKSPVTTLWTELFKPSDHFSLTLRKERNGKCNVLKRVVPHTQKDHSSVINLSSAGLESCNIYFLSLLLSLSIASNGTAAIWKKTQIYYSSIWHSYLYLMAKVLFNEWGDRNRGSIIVLSTYEYFFSRVIPTLHFCALWTHVSIFHFDRMNFQVDTRQNRKNGEKENLYAIIPHLFALILIHCSLNTVPERLDS